MQNSYLAHFFGRPRGIISSDIHWIFLPFSAKGKSDEVLLLTGCIFLNMWMDRHAFTCRHARTYWHLAWIENFSQL
jgi:hypothetical protein